MTEQVSNAFEESGKQRDAAEELVFALLYRGGADSAPLLRACQKSSYQSPPNIG